MPYVALNNAFSTLAGSLTNVATSCTVQTGHGARFAVETDFTYLTLEDSGGNIEIISCTARSGDTLTITRAQDGTTARAWNSGDIIECRPCKAALNEIKTDVATNAATSKAIPVDADALPLVDSAASNVLKKLTWANLKATAKAYFDTLYLGISATATNATNVTGSSQSTAINWNLPQRSALLTDNDLSFDVGAKQNFLCTPTGAGTLTFTNHSTQGGQSGYIRLVNGSNYAIAAHADTKITTADLAKISASGTYVMPYLCNGTDVEILGVWTRP